MATSGRSDDLERTFPGLRVHPYTVEIKASPLYNCIAWAAGDESRWWEPDENGVEYRPPGVLREYTLEAYCAAFESIGYVQCGDERPEIGFEKVALYALWGEPTHASRQLADGSWTSKIGREERIVHVFEALDGDEYGFPERILRRPIVQ